MITHNILLQLKSEDAVFINNLGTFKKQLVSAKTVKGKIHPPKYKIVLDTEEEGNSFNFVLKLSKNEKLRITDADKQVCQWVADIKQTLSEKGSCILEDFGTFSLLKSGKISFKSGKLSLLNREFEGMEEVEIPAKVALPTEETTRVEETAQVEETMPIVNEILEKEPKKTVEKQKRSLWWMVWLVLILALVLLFIFYYKPICQYALILKEKFKTCQQDKIQQKEADNMLDVIVDTITVDNPTTMSEISSDTTIELTNSEPEKIETSKKNEKSVIIPTKKVQSVEMLPITADQITFQSGKFYLISGSFTTIQDAQKHINTSGLSKYHPSILRQLGNDRYRVCVGIFETETEAEQYKTLLKISGWVLK